MVIFVTVNADNYQGRGVEYTNILFDSVRRNISDELPFEFHVFSDTEEGYDEGIRVRPLHWHLTGWFHKLYLFKDGLFPAWARIIYLDLSICVTSALDDYMAYEGPFAILRDFYRPEGLQSSVMMWPADTLKHIWDRYDGISQIPGGDQAHIEKSLYPTQADILQDLYSKQFVSYKEHAADGIPQTAHVVVFHGDPKPHTIKTGWVPHIWVKSGGSILHQLVVSNTEDRVVLRHVRSTFESNYEHLTDQYDAHTEKPLCIVGGGPSLEDDLPELRIRAETSIIWALNNSYKYLKDNGISPHCHVMLDARIDNAEFVPETDKITHLYASQCHPEVFKKAKGKIIIWNSYTEGVIGLLDEFKLRSAVVGNVTSVGLSAITLSKLFGFRNIHLFGFDSSYQDNANHAYAQPLNAGEKKIEVTCNGQKFTCAPWMATQVEDFKKCINLWLSEDLQITVHGNGLLPYVARLLSMPPKHGIEQKGKYWWPSNDYACLEVSEVEADKEIPKVLEYCAKRDVCVQAGGNVGIWPLKLAAYFNHIHTFEPDAENFECLTKNCNDIQHMTATNAGLSDKDETVGMNKKIGNCGAHFIEGDGQIRLLTIDSFNYPACDLLMLDIEGYELFALQGALETIKRCKPVIVTEEKGLGTKYGIASEGVSNFLKDLGYSVAKRLNNDVIYTPHS